MEGLDVKAVPLQSNRAPKLAPSSRRGSFHLICSLLENLNLKSEGSSVSPPFSQKSLILGRNCSSLFLLALKPSGWGGGEEGGSGKRVYSEADVLRIKEDKYSKPKPKCLPQPHTIGKKKTTTKKNKSSTCD